MKNLKQTKFMLEKLSGNIFGGELAGSPRLYPEYAAPNGAGEIYWLDCYKDFAPTALKASTFVGHQRFVPSPVRGEVSVENSGEKFQAPSGAAYSAIGRTNPEMRARKHGASFELRETSYDDFTEDGLNELFELAQAASTLQRFNASTPQSPNASTK